MITLRGTVSAQRQPIVTIKVRGILGRERVVDALLDTGFNGTLTLPPLMVLELGMPFRFARTIMLGDGTTQDVSSHRGHIIWEGVERPTTALSTGEQAIVGMGF